MNRKKKYILQWAMCSSQSWSGLEPRNTGSKT